MNNGTISYTANQYGNKKRESYLIYQSKRDPFWRNVGKAILFFSIILGNALSVALIGHSWWMEVFFISLVIFYFSARAFRKKLNFKDKESLAEFLIALEADESPKEAKQNPAKPTGTGKSKFQQKLEALEKKRKEA